MINMNTTVRTTITLPARLMDRLKSEAFYRKTTVSGILREGASKIVDFKLPATKADISSLVGKYAMKGKRGEFKRDKFYDQYLGKNVSI